MRTFVFISNIPDFLLQPIVKGDKDSAATSGKSASAVAVSKFDLRYERLRRLLQEQSSGVMLVMHLETRGYALALYASEGEALAACKADITPEQPGRQYSSLRLRIIEKEKPRPPEPVYQPCLTVEGEEVRKVDLADTRGLELVYRGRAVAKWCPRTLAGEDCFFGVSCLKLHRAAVQRAVRKRPRIDDTDADAHLSREQQATVRQLLSSMPAAREALSPSSVAVQAERCASVPITMQEAAALWALDGPASSPPLSSLPTDAACHAVLARVEAALQTLQATAASDGGVVAVFPRLSCLGGAPWDWAVTCEEGLTQLRRCCPLPANGAPTPLERDLYTQRLWYHMNQLNRCTSAEEVLRALRGSRRVRDALRRWRDASSSAAAAPSQNSAVAVPLSICLQPWLHLPTVGCEVSAFLERGGRRVRGVVQRHAQVRLMTSATLLASGAGGVEALLERYAVLESAADPAAEDALARELRLLQRAFAHAVGDIAVHLQTHPDAIGGDGAAWCVHLAALLPAAGTDMAAGSSTPSVVLLSATPYQQALEECPMYASLAPPTSGGAGGAEEAAAGATASSPVRPTKVEVSWNTQRHPYIPLFSREVLEQLRARAA